MIIKFPKHERKSSEMIHKQFITHCLVKPANEHDAVKCQCSPPHVVSNFRLVHARS